MRNIFLALLIRRSGRGENDRQ